MKWLRTAGRPKARCLKADRDYFCSGHLAKRKQDDSSANLDQCLNELCSNALPLMELSLNTFLGKETEIQSASPGPCFQTHGWETRRRKGKDLSLPLD